MYQGVQWVLVVAVHCAECGGKMHLREGEFSQAHTDFFEAFKNYDEAGSPRLVGVCMVWGVQ